MSKTILITGSSSGFGRLTAEKLASTGCEVYASMRDPQGKNKASADALKQQGINVIELDVTKNDSINSAVNTLLQKAGKLDVLINNAGVASAGISEAFTDQQVQALFDVNVIGTHRMVRACLPLFKQQKSGLIINIGSILGRVTFPFFGLYGASKYAVEAMTDSLRYEVSQLGIDVSLIQPSAYPTQMYASADSPQDITRTESYGEIANIPEAMFNQFMTMFEAQNAPQPHDVANAINTLIQTKAGQRPARVVVGESFGAEPINNAVAPIQQSTIEALGLGKLTELAIN